MIEQAAPREPFPIVDDVNAISGALKVIGRGRDIDFALDALDRIRAAVTQKGADMPVQATAVQQEDSLRALFFEGISVGEDWWQQRERGMLINEAEAAFRRALESLVQ